jgi:hypothetical protein
MNFNELNSSNSTIVTVNGTELRTTQNPYVSDDGEFYNAHAVDQDNNEYQLTWVVTNHDTDDESETCDWDLPSGVLTLK